MIQVTLSFESISDAHATLGLLMAQGQETLDVVSAGPWASNAPAVQAAVEVANAASEAMEAPASKPKRKPGRPKGSKDSTKIVRKGTKAAEALITLDSLRDDLQSYANEHGFKAARDILTQFTGGNGQPIKRIPDLQTDDYAKFQRALAKTPVDDNLPPDSPLADV